MDGSKFEGALIMDASYIRMRDAMYTGEIPLEGMQNFCKFVDCKYEGLRRRCKTNHVQSRR